MSISIRRRNNWLKSRGWRLQKCAALGLNPKLRCSRTPVSAQAPRRARRKCAKSWPSCAHAPELAIDGEMQGDCALDAGLRQETVPDCAFDEAANLLVFPNIDAANIAYNLLKSAAGNNI